MLHIFLKDVLDETFLTSLYILNIPVQIENLYGMSVTNQRFVSARCLKW